MAGSTREDGSGQRHLETSSSEVDLTLMGYATADFNGSNPRDDGNHTTTKPANPSSLTVPPLLDENATFFRLSHQIQPQRGVEFRASPPPTDLPISSIPSSAALWRYALPGDKLVAQPAEHSFNNPTTRNLLTNIGDAQYPTPYAELQPHDSMLESLLEDTRFRQDTNTVMSSYPNYSIFRSSLSSAQMTIPRDRFLPSWSHTSMDGLYPSHSHLESYVNSPRSLPSSWFGDLPPLANPLVITPNPSLSSEGSLCSDGEDDDSVVGSAAPSVCSTKRKMSYPALDDGRGTKFPTTQTVKKDKRGSSKMLREPRYSIQTRSNVDLMEDGYNWRKYGQKALKDSPHIRSYYRCTIPKCPARKRVERARDDPGLVITTYEGTHTHRTVAAAASNASLRSSESSYAARQDLALGLSQTGAKVPGWVTTACEVEEPLKDGDRSLGFGDAPRVPVNLSEAVPPINSVLLGRSLAGGYRFPHIGAGLDVGQQRQIFRDVLSRGEEAVLKRDSSERERTLQHQRRYQPLDLAVEPELFVYPQLHVDHSTTVPFNSSYILNMCNTYVNCGKFEDFCHAEGIHGERMLETGRGRLTAALFPGAFYRHLKTLSMTSKSSKANLPHLLQEAANLVVQDLPYATTESQVGESQMFQFFDEVYNGDPVDVDDVFSLGGLIAVCQKFPHDEKQNLEDLGTNYSTEYCIVHHDLTGAYLCRRVVKQVIDDQLLENAIGVLGVEVTGKDVYVENIRNDGSYYSGTLKDFSYRFVLNNNGDSEAMQKQCATRLFGHVKGAEFLAGKEYGLKCSPLLAIALTIATQKNRTLTLKWSRTYGHMEIGGLEHFMEFGKMKWQVLYTDKINQLGVDVEWGMEQVLKTYEMTNSQASGTSNHSKVQSLASVFGNGVQQKRSLGLQLSLPGGVGIGGSIEVFGSKGKELAKEAHPQILEHLRREASKFVETSDLDAKHAHVKDDLLQGRLPDAQYNYLVVWDDADKGHVSVYWAMDDDKLKWITDILLPCGKRDHEKLFKGGLKGLRMTVKRDGSKLVSTNAHKPASDLISRFKKHKQLDIDSSMTHVPPGLQSNDEWVHLIGPQAKYSGNKFLWEATFMRAIVSSRTSYLSGAMLDPFVLRNKFGEIGHCSRNKFDEIGQSDSAARLIHHTDRVAAWGQFSKAPTSLVQGTNLIKWGGLIDENDLC